MKSTFAIDGRGVGIGQPCYVIAEAGADAIKFQSYTAGRIATRVAPRYWVEPDDPRGTQWDTFDRLDKLTAADFAALLAHARAVGITAFSTPFDDQAVDDLVALDVPAFKIASADLTCHGLIERHRAQVVGLVREVGVEGGQLGS
ncbi:MAG TPA: N-acetylneuraminate synthase family protein, partial [Vicinamibacteria bacterium]|nr:N-acetylneuraminate synthase family protein [Vicinamibacteria bacterium]